jgi:exopolyphosphatase/guanosine-5'-triphosphate,3'-diphosphate pyrophosphatase
MWRRRECAAQGRTLGRFQVGGFQEDEGTPGAPGPIRSDGMGGIGRADAAASDSVRAQSHAPAHTHQARNGGRAHPVLPQPSHAIASHAHPSHPLPHRAASHNSAAHPAHPAHRPGPRPRYDADGEDDAVYGALDLGTNNCRLLLARPSRRGFRVIDAFSRIIRLGEGVTQSRALSEPAMQRTLEALKVCAGKIERHEVRRAMLVATEACRIADNGAEFLARAREATGLDIQILSREGEARLAVAGCASLVDTSCDYALVFDIGGGSSELIWLDMSRGVDREHGFADRLEVQSAMAAWTSLSVGVVTLAERFGGRHVTRSSFEAMVDHVLGLLVPFEAEHRFAERIKGRSVHLLGTSGTVTTVAGVHLGLERYDRNRVDGCWLESEAARGVTYGLLDRSYNERIAEPCIGRDRADLVLAGCAILEALMRMWPSPRLRVADRGLREGILMQLMIEDGVYRAGRRRRRFRGRGERDNG